MRLLWTESLNKYSSAEGSPERIGMNKNQAPGKLNLNTYGARARKSWHTWSSVACKLFQIAMRRPHHSRQKSALREPLCLQWQPKRLILVVSKSVSLYELEPCLPMQPGRPPTLHEQI